MSSDNKDHIIKEFQKEIWLYLDEDLTERRIIYWNEKIEKIPELLDMLNETKHVLNIYDTTMLADLDDPAFDKMLNRATVRSSILEKVKRFFSGLNSSGDSGEFNIHKIAFGGILVIAAMVIFTLTDKPNPVKTIGGDVFDWDAEAISEQLTDIHNSLGLAQNDKMREFILYKQTSDDWSRSVYTMEKRLQRLNKEVDDKSL
jgi:hypothetical protein